jgi:asparagine synthase (glutamine-hydrolysing)
MSGLCGIFRFDGGSVAQDDLDRQMARLAHLGPDRARTWRDGRIGLGQLLTRVSIEDRLEAQPLVEGDLALVADLRLDNREDLAAKLAVGADALRDMPDSALLLRAWRHWGEGCVEHLLGDFAFAVWNARSGALSLVRDHMGQRYVRYHAGDGFFAFATEIKGLWALPQVPRVLHEDILAGHMRWDEATDDVIGTTMYEGIRYVPGGTVLTVDPEGRIVSHRYWEPHADPTHLGRDEAYYVAAYRRVLREAVECRLRRATTPAGLFMGGGFDSSAICGLAGPVVTAQGRKFIAAASVMPADYQGTIRHARRWVEMCRRDMPWLDVRYVTSEDHDLLSGTEEAFLRRDSPHSPNRADTEALLKAIAASGARIVMDGHGGDYTLNPRGQKALVQLLYRGQFRRFAAEFRATRRHLGQSVKQTLVRNVIVAAAPSVLMLAWNNRRHGLRAFGPTVPLSRLVIADRRRGARSRFAVRGASQRDSMLRTLRGQQNRGASGYGIPAAAFGLVFTQPFHDKRVVELGLAIPEALFVKNGLTRYLARQALRHVYPPEFQTRRPGNDDLGPDFLRMVKRIEPRVLAEIDRMERAGYLTRYFDFGRMRAMLTRRTIDQHNSGSEYDTRQAMLAFLTARYIEWFRGANG